MFLKFTADIAQSVIFCNICLVHIFKIVMSADTSVNIFESALFDSYIVVHCIIVGSEAVKMNRVKYINLNCFGRTYIKVGNLTVKSTV